MRKLLLAAAIALFGVAATQSAEAQTPISSATLVVRDTAVAPTSVAASKTTVCSGDTTRLTITGGNRGANGKWQWYKDACGGAGATAVTTDSATGTATPTLPTNTTNSPITVTYYVRSEGSPCGNSICKQITITVNPASTMNATVAGGRDTVCNGTTKGYAFSSSNTGGTVTYSWTNSNTATGIPASGTGNIPASTVLTAAGDTITISRIIVTPTYANGGSSCPGRPDTFYVNVRPTPNGTLAVNTPICEGQAVNLTFTSSVPVAAGPYNLEVRQYNSANTPPAAPYTQYTGKTSAVQFSGLAPLPTAASTWKFDLMKITDKYGCSRSAQ